MSDPILVDIAERKNQTLLYHVDTKGTVIDGRIVKCIRSTECSYKLSIESKIRCSVCQDLLQSCLHWQKTPSSETSQSKTAHDSHCKLNSMSHAELIIRAKNLHKMVAQSERKAKRYNLIYQKEKPC